MRYKGALAAGAVWLAEAHPVPPRVWDEWEQALSMALIPCGRRWDAVRIRHGEDRPGPEVLRVLGEAGPALIHWHGIPYLYVLVPPGTAATWAVPGTVAFGLGTWLPMPKPSRACPATYTAAEWAVLPDGSGNLTPAEHLANALSLAACPTGGA